MILMDSSGWVEIVGDGPRKAAFLEAVAKADQVLVPTIVVREVYRAVDRQAGLTRAQQVLRYLSSLEIVPLDLELAVRAAEAAREFRLALADSVVYATAIAAGARLVTGDGDFAALPDVEYIPAG